MVTRSIMSADFPPQRRYDKGLNRRKHVGTSNRPSIEFDDSEPKKWVGKCPNNRTLPDDLKHALLNEAIPGPQGDRGVDYVKTLFVVHDGTIYAAQTSDAGVTYHGYPFKGGMSRATLQRLKEMAEAKDCEKEFREWVKAHIILHGEGR